MSRPADSRFRKRRARNADWQDAFLTALEDALSRDHRDSSIPQVGLRGLSASRHRFTVELRFVSGVLYCCAEPGCHLRAYSLEWWRGFRSSIEHSMGDGPASMTMRVHGVVEAGARLATLSSIGLPDVSEAYTYLTGGHRERDAK